jgi:fermentation-respiration switch protein FrsA (DUF1100 family)
VSRFLRFASGLTLIALLAVLTVALHAGVSAWSVAYLVGLQLPCGALVVQCTPWKHRLLAAGGAVLAMALLGRTVTASPRQPGFGIVTLPAADGPRTVNSLLPESDGALLAAAALDMQDGGESLKAVLHAAYARMDRTLGHPATPAIATYLGFQSPRAFDTIIIEPDGASPPETAVLFLHGFAGNFDVYCWHLALAAKATHTLVVCPSVGPLGDWWRPHGLLTVRRTIAYLHDRGIAHIHLAGISNGARGAATLAPLVASEIEGLILISGASPESAPPEVPLLVIQGERDGMMPAELSRSYLSRAVARRTYVPLPGGHFVFLSRTEEATRAISAWLKERTATPLRRDAQEPGSQP